MEIAMREVIMTSLSIPQGRRPYIGLLPPWGKVGKGVKTITIFFNVHDN
jgi:hypothetical protein